MSSTIDQTIAFSKAFKEKFNLRLSEIKANENVDISKISRTNIGVVVELENGDQYMILNNSLVDDFSTTAENLATQFNVTVSTIKDKVTRKMNVSTNNFRNMLIDDCIDDFNGNTNFVRIKNLCYNNKCDSIGSDTDREIDAKFSR